MSPTSTSAFTPLAVTALPGVGANLAQLLAKLQLHQVQDLLFHLPLRYLDRTRITPIGEVGLNTTVVLEGVTEQCEVALGRRRSLIVRLADSTGSITLRFFHFNAAQKNALAPGAHLRCYGDIRLGKNGLELYHPEYTLVTPGQALPVETHLTPIYPLTEGISQVRMRKVVQAAVALMRTHPPRELLPAAYNARFGVASLSEALTYLHHPPKDADTTRLLAGDHPFQLRLAFEELLAHHLALQQSRAQVRALSAPALCAGQGLWHQLRERLPYCPTAAQARVIAELQQDLAKPHPMLRLVQGDVGSGKTLVAAAAALSAVDAGKQVALVAPTEILAEQHRTTFSGWFTPLGIEVAWLVGKLPPAQKRANLAAIATGQAPVVVGTHALLQEHVEFAALGLVIIDEQHRFGVHQRLSLARKNTAEVPHQLVMTATPIPRTLAMTAYADLDLSIIDELPPGRQPITTVLISQARKDAVIERVRNAAREGRQMYWVCPLVEDSESVNAAAAENTASELEALLPELAVGLVHGRLKSKVKDEVMAKFKSGALQVLVATTVIEVGVDVPNASVMIIENPERLGLAQLHQLRGRVGRGQTASYCVLLYGEALSQVARHRLQVLRDSQDGFALAEADLALRGPGELLGSRQTGVLNLRLADLVKHGSLLAEVVATAQEVAHLDPALSSALLERWFPDHLHYLQG